MGGCSHEGYAPHRPRGNTGEIPTPLCPGLAMMPDTTALGCGGLFPRGDFLQSGLEQEQFEEGRVHLTRARPRVLILEPFLCAAQIDQPSSTLRREVCPFARLPDLLWRRWLHMHSMTNGSCIQFGNIGPVGPAGNLPKSPSRLSVLFGFLSARKRQFKPPYHNKENAVRTQISPWTKRTKWTK